MAERQDFRVFNGNIKLMQDGIGFIRLKFLGEKSQTFSILN